jgi:hypothetical protein
MCDGYKQLTLFLVIRSEEADISARAANVQQVSDYITTNSVGNAVLVLGDTNARYTRVGDGIRIFHTQNELINPWVELILDGVEPVEGADAVVCGNPTTSQTCETVDKILYVLSPSPFDRPDSIVVWPPLDRSQKHKLIRNASYRGSRALALRATSWSYEDEKFLNNGSILSDHNPISSTFAWSRSGQFRMSDLFGGPHG